MSWSRVTAVALFLAAISLSVSAHPAQPTPSAGGAAVLGFVHPFIGLDHLLAMLSVGLLAGRGKRRVWLMPAFFSVGMLAGGVASIVWGGESIGGIEQWVAASVVALGLMLVLARRLPAWVAVAAVPLFAVFHGHAHLNEAATGGAADLASYMTGMIVGSLALMAIGAGVGRLLSLRTVPSETLWRVTGGVVACTGVALFVAL